VSRCIVGVDLFDAGFDRHADGASSPCSGETGVAGRRLWWSISDARAMVMDHIRPRAGPMWFAARRVRRGVWFMPKDLDDEVLDDMIAYAVKALVECDCVVVAVVRFWRVPVMVFGNR